MLPGLFFFFFLKAPFLLFIESNPSLPISFFLFEFFPICVNRQRGLNEWKMWVNIQRFKPFQSFGKSWCIFPSLKRAGENEIQAWSGVFQWIKAFSDLYLGGKRWDHYTVTVYVWCAHQSLARYLTDLNLLEVFLFFFSIIQPDKHTAGVFTCTVEEGNHHLALTVAFHEPMMSAFHLPSCIQSLNAPYAACHSLISWLTANKYYTNHAWINKMYLIGVQQIEAYCLDCWSCHIRKKTVKSSNSSDMKSPLFRVNVTWFVLPLNTRGCRIPLNI